MIPTPRNWKVTFYLNPEGVKLAGTDKISHTICCVKRFAKAIANERLGYIGFHYATKVTVGLVN
jgi:hypothetical protein